MKNLVIFALVILFVLIAFIYKFFVAAPPSTSGLTTLKIGEQEFQVEVAKDDVSRSRGLSGREYMAREQGMLFIFDTAGNHGFWMKGMKFSLDIVWIREGRIVGFSENLPPVDEGLRPPPIYYPPEVADMVLEINAGLVQKYEFKVGDPIMYNN
ncbi:MAG: DUF192 domain-containing protein [Candidatus Liptonbacteria bacterium]|nr:DUF192 domain-containing protein [Candidatus Liptonbacteria bacterium]